MPWRCPCIYIIITCCRIYFVIFFKPDTEVHSYNTRPHSLYHVAVCRLAHTAKNIRYVGVKCHAVFGLCLSYCSSPHFYKKAVKGMLLTKENRNINLWFVICLLRYAVNVDPGLPVSVIVYCGHDAFCVSICESHSPIVRNEYANFSCTSISLLLILWLTAISCYCYCEI